MRRYVGLHQIQCELLINVKKLKQCKDDMVNSDNYYLHLYLLFYGRELGTVMQADYINFVFKFSLPW